MSESLLIILASLSSVVFRAASILPYLSTSLNLFSRFLETVPRVQTITGIPLLLFYSLWIFPLSLSDSKFIQLSRTLLSVLVKIRSAVVCTISILPQISNFPTLFSKFMEILPRAPTTIGIAITFMFNSFFSSLARFRNLSVVLLSFIFIPWVGWNGKIYWMTNSFLPVNSH